MRSRLCRLLGVVVLLFVAFSLGLSRLPSDGTVYSPGYSESKFKSIRVGMPREQVIRMLGEP
jgi:outer membrane protein assembly factor BamE (lipoprotein component of BamABCDE complex)